MSWFFFFVACLISMWICRNHSELLWFCKSFMILASGFLDYRGLFCLWGKNWEKGEILFALLMIYLSLLNCLINLFIAFLLWFWLCMLLWEKREGKEIKVIFLFEVEKRLKFVILLWFLFLLSAASCNNWLW